MKIVLISFIALFSFVLTYLIRFFALKYKIVDIPNERSSHQSPTPRGGGLAIVITWYFGISILLYLKIIEDNLYYALLSGSIIAIVSIVDDLIRVKPAIRLFIHFITVIIAFKFIGELRPLIMPNFEINYYFIIYPLAIIGMVWFINLFNFMDGLDGFASTEAIILALVMFAYSGSIINLLLIACIAGFLFWNWPKAKIFLGDVGSTQLGFILVVLGIYFHNTYKFSILNWIMLSSPFWFDATYTLYRRWRNMEKLSQAHKKHVYQRIVQAGFSHQKVNFTLIIINAIVVIFILIYREFKVLQIPLFILSLTFFYLITKLVDKKVPFK
ncbi:MAG: glycosyltransferase family 4 protein [Bacteroidales bacterium]|nr:glycosyltransferase family 4 protein [Bacteroidales bacterium]